MLDLLMKRHSIRKYTEDAIAPSILQEIIQGALLAPSSKNTRPWEFVVVQDRALLENLSASRQPQMLALVRATAAIVVMADTTKNDVWVEDCAIAAILLQLTATDLGVGSCWIQMRNRMAATDGQTSDAYVKACLNIPEHYAVEAIVTLGYPAQEKAPAKLENLLYDKVHGERYGQAYFVGDKRREV